MFRICSFPSADVLNTFTTPEATKYSSSVNSPSSKLLQTDEWGNLWCRVREVGGGEVVHGAIEDDWALLDHYVWPDLDAAERYVDAAAVFAANPDRYRLGSLPGFPFAIARYMRRMEVFLADILLEPEQATRLLQNVTDLLERCIQRYAEIGADGVFFCEDWGTQDRLLVSPAHLAAGVQARVQATAATRPTPRASQCGCTPAATSTRSSRT